MQLEGSAQQVPDLCHITAQSDKWEAHMKLYLPSFGLDVSCMSRVDTHRPIGSSPVEMT